jgi:hypothetical protein
VISLAVIVIMLTAAVALSAQKTRRERVEAAAA